MQQLYSASRGFIGLKSLYAIGWNCRMSVSSVAAGKFVKIVEVGPRDGLQNEKCIVPTDVKVELINRLSRTGLCKIEVTSFVSRKWVPQMEDAQEVCRQIERLRGVTYTALTPNLQGLRAAIDARVNEVAVFAAASETFSRKNINCSIGESMDRFREVVKTATAVHLPVRGYVSCVVGCPYEKQVAPAKVAEVVRALLGMGCYEVSLGDTIGCGTPDSVDRMLSAVLTVAPVDRLVLHCHDTQGRALENIEIALARGVRTLDASVGGLGGCPYAGPGATGNVATEAVVRRVEQLGYHTGVDADKVEQIGAWILKQLKRQNTETTPKL